jgi:CubicO group peptidase (beta-lactamase class C family)
MDTEMKCFTFFLFLSSFVVNAQDLYFPPNFSGEWSTIEPSELNWCDENIEELNTFLEETNTNSFLILKDGKIAHEAYFNDFDLNSNWYWASAGKTITSAMVGIVQEEGLLDINDLTTEYLGSGWTSCSTEEENKITIRNQLTMTTGLDYTVDDIYCLEPDCLLCLNEPGEEWYYHNAPYTLLADIIESALDQGYTAATNAKLANKIGFLGLWTKVETGRLFFSTARGMARFGLLMLNEGNWNGEDIIKDKAYLNDMITSSQELNKSYGYLWWLNGKESHRLPGLLFNFQGSIMPDAPDDLYAAIGKNGQILMVVPSQNMIVVRMGNNPDNSLVPVNYVRELWNEIEGLSCSVSTESIEDLIFTVNLDLSSKQLVINSQENIDKVTIFGVDGNQLLATTSKRIDISQFSNGIYFVHAKNGNRSAIRRFMKF